MCPLSCLQLASEEQSDEMIFMSLFNFKSGEPLPINVTSDVNPYQHRPSDLPADLWYLCSGLKKDADHGFWHETEVACEIFSNSVILGLRTTLQFHEGRAPHGRKTDWLMHEYRITDKYNNDPMDVRALCRVFMNDTDVKIFNKFGPETVSASEFVGKIMENSLEPDCILTGDYIELNDLADLGSRSFSSSDSSSLTMNSEEYFDSMALLQELHDDIIDQEMKDSCVKCNSYAPVKSKQVVLQTATSVASPRNNKGCKPSAEETSKVENRTGSTSNGVNNEHVSRTKRRKMMKYLCFLAF